jgi:TPR repeat protein
VAILYYAGHSVQIDGANYLIPVDATLSSVQEVDTQTLNIARLVNLMDKFAKTKIIVLDACRDNPFLPKVQEALAQAGDTRSAGQGLANINEPSSYKLAQEEVKTYGTIIAYAAAPGDTAADGDGRNSPYTAAFLRHVEKPGLEVGQMFREVAASVIEETKGVQKPEYLVKLTNEFYFLRPEPNACDRLAVAPFNQVGLPGVEFDAIKAKEAVPACEKAVASNPAHPRFLHNLGRAYDAAGKYKKAVEFYQKSADADFVPAINNLGVMYINGQGVKQNFRKGVDLLKQAFKRGNKHARVAMQTTDFSVLFEEREFAAVQKALSREGDYNSGVDGKFGAGSKQALETYQARNKLARKGLTLETLDALGLVNVIPAYTLD